MEDFSVHACKHLFLTTCPTTPLFVSIGKILTCAIVPVLWGFCRSSRHFFFLFQQNTSLAALCEKEISQNFAIHLNRKWFRVRDEFRERAEVKILKAYQWIQNKIVLYRVNGEISRVSALFIYQIKLYCLNCLFSDTGPPRLVISPQSEGVVSQT